MEGWNALGAHDSVDRHGLGDRVPRFEGRLQNRTRNLLKRIIGRLGVLLCLCALAFSAKDGIVLKEMLSIGSAEDDVFYFVTHLATDDSGCFYVTDSKDCTVKKFDARGRMIAKAGRKGQGPGDFQYPVLIACYNKSVFIVDQNASGIRVYDTDLKYVRSIIYPLPIYSLVALSDNELLVVTMGKSVFPPLARIDLRKTGAGEAGLSDFKPEAWWKYSGKITTDQNKNIFYVSSFEDIIAKFDPRGNLQWKKGLRLGEKPNEMTLSTKLGPMTVPTEIIYKDIAVDRKGRLFVMGGHKAVHRSRDIYVLNENGDLIETLTLPQPTHFLHFDKNGDLFVLANDGVTIKKYRLEDKK